MMWDILAMIVQEESWSQLEKYLWTSFFNWYTTIFTISKREEDADHKPS